MERGAGAADLRRLQRPGVSRRRSRPRRCCARGCGGSTPWACNSRCAIAGPAGTTKGRLLFQTPDGPVAVDARATVLALGGASWPRLGSDGGVGGNARREGRGDIAAQARQLRFYGRLVGHLPRSLRRPAAEGRGAVVRPAHRARRSRSSRAPASRAARSMRCRPICAKPSSASGRGDAAHRPAARSRQPAT